MSEKLIPEDAHRAAKRGFIRTTAQAYAATIPAGGVSAGALLAVAQNPDPMVIGVTVIAALVSPVLAGLAAYFSLLGSGIPVDYAFDTALNEPVGALTDPGV